MKVLSWIIRIMIVALGIGLFMLQSQSAKKSILELILNQSFKDSPIHVEVDNVRGLFPFQFEVSSLKLKDGDEVIRSLSNVIVVWSLPELMAQEIKLNVKKENELTGDIIYHFRKHTLLIRLQGDGVSIWKGKLDSLIIDLPSLDLLRGSIIAKIQDGQQPITLSCLLEELDAAHLKISDIKLEGEGIHGFGHVMVYPKEGAWEGEGALKIEELHHFSHLFQKDLGGKANIILQKKRKGPLNLEADVKSLKYETVGVKTLGVNATLTDSKAIRLSLKGQQAIINKIPLSHILATASLEKNKWKFEFDGKGPQHISLESHGIITLPSSGEPLTKMTLSKASVSHPVYQLSLTQPATIEWANGKVHSAKLLLSVGNGKLELQDFTIGEENLSGSLYIRQIPLTILRVFNPDWDVSGNLSGNGKLSGTLIQPEAELSIDGKSLKWAEVSKMRTRNTNRFLATDIASTFRLKDNHLNWQVKMGSGQFFNLSTQGKIEVKEWSINPKSSLDGNLIGKGELSILSLFIRNGDLIKGQGSIDLVAKGNVNNPQITGHITVHNGLYENAAFGTLIRNIKLQAKATNDRITISHISGQDNVKGHVNGHATLKLTSLLNPEVDLKLILDKMLVIRNDELSGKASGILKLQGEIFTQGPKGAKITGDLILKPLDIRLDERPEEFVTIKLVEKDKKGSYLQIREQKNQGEPKRDSEFFPLDIKLNSPKKIYLRGYGLTSQWKGNIRALGSIGDPYLVGQITLIRGSFDLLGKPLKLSEGLITFDKAKKNDPLLSIAGVREVGEVTATMRIEGRGSSPKITFSSSPALPQEEVLARLLFGRGLESMSITQSLLLANALSSFKGENNLNFSEKIRTVFGLDTLEIKEHKSPDDDEYKSEGQQVSVGKQITDKVYLSLDQSVSGESGTSATLQYDVTPTLKIEGDVGGNKNTGIGFAWVKKY